MDVTGRRAEEGGKRGGEDERVREPGSARSSRAHVSVRVMYSRRWNVWREGERRRGARRGRGKQ